LKNELLLVSYAKAVIFLIVWNLFYFQTYPRFLNFWANIILESSSFRNWYLAWIATPLGLHAPEGKPHEA